MNWDAIVWLALMIVFFVAEGACPFHLVSVWFAIGSLGAMVAALLGGPLWLQAVLFFVISCGLLILMFPLVKKIFKPKVIKTNVDAVIGTKGHVTEDIDNIDALGQVKLGGMFWSARSTSGDPISKGTLVKVDAIEGVKVFVTPVDAPEKVG